MIVLMLSARAEKSYKMPLCVIERGVIIIDVSPNTQRINVVDSIAHCVEIYFNFCVHSNFSDVKQFVPFWMSSYRVEKQMNTKPMKFRKLVHN